MRKLSLLLLTTILFVGCLSDLDLEKFNDPDFVYDGKWILPVANIHFTLEDMIGLSENIYEGPNNVVHVKHYVEGIGSLDASDYSEIPAQDTMIVPLTITTTGSQTFKAGLGTIGGAQLYNILIGGGELVWTIKNLSGSVDMSVEILDAQINGNPFVFNINANGPLSTGVQSLENLNFDLTNGTNPYNNLGFEFTISNSTLPPGTPIEIELLYNNLFVNAATGFLGTRVINLPGFSQTIDFGGIENFFDGFYLTQPSIALEYISNIGVPLEYTSSITGINANNEPTPLNAPPFTATGPTTMGDWDTTLFVIDNQNSNLADFIAALPNQINASGFVEINPSGQTITNFIPLNGQSKLNLDIDFPLDLRAENIRFEQLIENVDFGLDGNDTGAVNRLVFNMKGVNRLPLDGELTALIMENNVAIDSIKFGILEAADVNAQGRVETPKEYITSTTLSKSQIDNFILSRNILVKGVFNTTQNGQVPVTFYTDYTLDLQVSIEVDLNVDYQTHLNDN